MKRLTKWEYIKLRAMGYSDQKICNKLIVCRDRLVNAKKKWNLAYFKWGAWAWKLMDGGYDFDTMEKMRAELGNLIEVAKKLDVDPQDLRHYRRLIKDREDAFFDSDYVLVRLKQKPGRKPKGHDKKIPRDIMLNYFGGDFLW
jgi:hypothetical protein